MLEGPRPCAIFCFALIHYAWIMLPTRFYWLVPQYGVNNYYVLCTVKAKKRTKTYNKEPSLGPKNGQIVEKGGERKQDKRAEEGKKH